MKLNQSRIQNLKSKIGVLARLACSSRLLRLHPKFRWLTYACPIVERTGSTRAAKSPVKHVVPPPGPPKLRLRKRRRLSVKRAM